MCVCTHLCIALGWTPRNGIVRPKGMLSKLANAAEQQIACFPTFLPTRGVITPGASQTEEDR